MKSTRPRRKAATQGSTDFSFSSDLPRFASKDGFTTGNVTFAIHAIDFDPGGGYTGGNRWKITIVRGDSGASEVLTLPSNERRDAQLQAARDHLAAKGPIRNVRLVKSGGAYYFRAAETPQCTK